MKHMLTRLLIQSERPVPACKLCDNDVIAEVTQAFDGKSETTGNVAVGKI